MGYGGGFDPMGGFGGFGGFDGGGANAGGFMAGEGDAAPDKSSDKKVKLPINLNYWMR